MPQSPEVHTRINPDLLEAARIGAGLPADTPVSHILRYGLALMAGKPDPLKTARHAPRFTRQPDNPTEARARAAYRASLAVGEPIARGALVRRFGISVYRARMIVADCKTEHRTAA